MNLFTFRLLGLAIFAFSSVAFIAEATSHEHIHHVHHNHRREMEIRDTSITAENSVFPRAAAGTTQLFNASDLSMLSSGCASALAGTLACSDLIWSAASLYTWGGLTLANLTNLCTTGCNSSITTFRNNVLSACASDIYTDKPHNATGFVYGTGTPNDIYNVQGVSVKPIAFADYYFLNWNLNCMKDNSSPQNYCYMLTGNNTSNGTSVNPCGPCGLDTLKVQLQDPRTYDDDLASEYSSLASSCKVTVAPITSPTPVFLADPNTIVANYTTTSATCTGTVVPIASGVSCDQFAATNKISTDQLLMLNKLQGGCADWPGNKTSLCVQGSCKPYIVQRNDTCRSVAAANNMTLIQLLSFNPTIDPVCANFYQEIGHVICLTNPLGYTVPNATNLGLSPNAATTAAPVPPSAMTGSNTYCGQWYFVNPGDYCALITNKNGITLTDFYFLNPEVNSTCGNLWANQSYCVQPVGDISTYPGYGGSTATTISFVTDTALTWSLLPTTTAPSYVSATPTGYPLAPESLSSCFKMFNNIYGKLACEGVASMFGVEVGDWVRWNPSVLNGANYSMNTCFVANNTQYCGSFYNQSLVPSFTQGFAPLPTDSTANATTQCFDWYFTISGDTCDGICKSFDIPFSSFYKWNPAVGSDCGSLWTSASYCVAGPGYQNVSYPHTTTISSSTTKSGAPAPTQTGIVANCQAWYVAKSGDGCGAIATSYNISLAQFYAWNPAVGTTCASLIAGDAYCVKAPTTISSTTSTTSKPITTTSKTSVTPPGPTQSGIPANCNKYAIVTSGGCIDFAAAQGITLANLYLWNPVLNNNCENFWANEAYCVGVSS